MALALLLMAAAVGVLGTPAARAQDEPAAYGCGVKEFEVTLESVVGAEEAAQTPAGEPVPVGLYRPVKQIFGVISDSAVSAEKAKPSSSRSGTGTGVAPLYSMTER